jgi:predicted RND superfamily exporter protein
MWAKFAAFVLRYRVGCLVFVGIFTVVMGYYASKAQLSYNMAKVIPADDPDYLEYLDFKGKFGEDGNVLVIGVRNKDLFELEFFNAWYDLNNQIDSIEGVQNVLSVPRLYNIVKNDSLRKFDVVPLIPHKPQTQAELDSIRIQIDNLKFYKDLLYNADSNVTLMAITLEKDKLDSKLRIALVKQIEEKAKAFGEQFHSQMHFSGLPYIRTVYSTKVAKELQMFTLLAMLVTAIMMLLFFRSFAAMFYSMVVVGICVVATMALIPLFGFRISLLTGLVPPLIVVTSIQNCIYLLNVYHFEFRIHRNKIKALTRVLTKIGLASFLTNLTTAVGFGVFSFSGSVVMDEFSLVSAVAIMISFVISMIVIPAVFSMLPDPTFKQTKHLENKALQKFVDSISYSVVHHRKTIYSITIVVLIISFIGIFKVKSIGYMVDDIPHRDPVYTDLVFFEQHFKGVMPFEISIDTHKKRGVQRVQVLQKIEELQNVLATYPELSRSLSVADMMKFSNQAFYRGNPARYRLPNEQEKSFILSYVNKSRGNSVSGSSVTRSLMDSNAQVARISVQMADVGSVEIKRIQDELAPKINEIFDSSEYKVNITGTSVIFLKGNDYLIDNLTSSMFWALVLISLLMAFLFFSWKMVLISLVPNLIPLIMVLGIMGYADITLKTSTILIFSIAYGIVVDLTIHFLAKYRHELKKRNWDIGSSVSYSMHESGVSMIYTTVILFFGFIIFAASSFGGTVALGVLTSLALVIGLFTNLFLLPSLLLSLEKAINAKKELGTTLIDIEEEDEDEA